VSSLAQGQVIDIQYAL